MPERISAAKRVQMQIVAEREVMRYAGDHALWHKHVHNVELDPAQILKMKEMDLHSNTIDFSSRRTGKTACKELHELKHNACNADQELGIVAPREAQSLVNLGYHLEAIRRSEILTAYLAHKSGRVQLSDTKYEFANRSKAQAYGIMAQVDGGDLTGASLEEVDDMPKDRLFSRFLLMLGSTRRLGASKASSNKPHIRITGVFKGADTLTDLLEGGNFHAIGAFHGERARAEVLRLVSEGWLSAESVGLDPDLVHADPDRAFDELENYTYPVPVLNAVNAMGLGLLNEQFIHNIRGDLSEDEFVRQLLCINTASRNLVWEIYMRRALQVGLEAGIELAQPLPGETYKKRGMLAVGYDHTGHGENPQASRSAFVVCEQIGGFTCIVYVRTWPPGTDELVIKRDLVSYWRYFRPDKGIGDAYGIGLLTQVNDELFAEGLTEVDRRAIADGESTASTWPEWAFSPLRFEGMTKHQMAQAVRSVFHNQHAAVPYFDDRDPGDTDTADLRLLVRQILNVKPEPTKTSYSSYKMANAKLGDDGFDALMAAVWALVTRGAAAVETVISTRKRTREQLLGQAPIRLPSDPIDQVY